VTIKTGQSFEDLAASGKEVVSGKPEELRRLAQQRHSQAQERTTFMKANKPQPMAIPPLQTSWGPEASSWLSLPARPASTSPPAPGAIDFDAALPVVLSEDTIRGLLGMTSDEPLVSELDDEEDNPVGVAEDVLEAEEDPALQTIVASVTSRFDHLAERLEKIETQLALLSQKQAIKEWYSTAEVAQILERAEFTVREWCRLGRVNASKRECGRGESKEWIISHPELERIKNEGLLPQPKVSTRLR
jgi:hypothetical protein